jgi:hypothetical protein
MRRTGIAVLTALIALGFFPQSAAETPRGLPGDSPAAQALMKKLEVLEKSMKLARVGKLPLDAELAEIRAALDELEKIPKDQGVGEYVHQKMKKLRWILARLAEIERTRSERTAEEKAVVTVRFPDLTADDASNPAKVAEAFRKATADMIFSVAEGPPARYAPTPAHENESAGHGDYRPRAGEPAFRTTWVKAPEAWIEFRIEEAKGRALPPRTAVLVWQKTSTTAVVVTPDGGRYEMDLYCSACGKLATPTLVRALGAPQNWPAPLQDVTLCGADIGFLEKIGLIAAGTAVALAKLRSEAEACAQATGSIAERTKRCTPWQKKFEALVAEAIRDRNRQRLKAYETSLARLKELAASR